ncbi:ABC transporter ATP-binding protein [Maricaulaceae bacterium EIL42A08]|nr:ABC transporter ATP-binding protein [Maricaulaceae bacterium EIL42A08]
MLVKIDHLEKSYGSGEDRQPVLRGISLEIDRGESLAITGESGSGKSTLLHMIGLLDAPDAGTIQIDGERVSDLDDKGRAARRRSQIGLVFQQFNLVPSLTVRQNIALQARLAKRLDPNWIDMLTERLGLTAFSDRFPEQLSGGQQQRVAVARALATRPALLLADEPTGNLDEETSAQVLALMLELCADAETALIMVTHSIAAAELLSRRVHLTGGRLS